MQIVERSDHHCGDDLTLLNLNCCHWFTTENHDFVVGRPNVISLRDICGDVVVSISQVIQENVEFGRNVCASECSASDEGKFVNGVTSLCTFCETWFYTDTGKYVLTLLERLNGFVKTFRD